MAETTDTNRGAEAQRSSVTKSTPEARAWFVREVVPLESVLMHYLQHNWRDRSEIADLRQEVYARVFEAACEQIPERPKQFVFATARNLLVDRVRQAQIVPIEAVADFEAVEIARDVPGPDRSVIARDELRRLQIALDRLPPRCREAVVLRKIDGHSLREIAQRMGIAEKTVKAHLNDGVRALADMRYGEQPSARGNP
jgi:RNA polymerase sigma factor (sigma-70 family)